MTLRTVQMPAPGNPVSSGGSKGGMKVGGLKDPLYILYYIGLFPIRHLPSSHLLSSLVSAGFGAQGVGF